MQLFNIPPKEIWRQFSYYVKAIFYLVSKAQEKQLGYSPISNFFNEPMLNFTLFGLARHKVSPFLSSAITHRIFSSSFSSFRFKTLAADAPFDLSPKTANNPFFPRAKSIGPNTRNTISQISETGNVLFWKFAFFCLFFFCENNVTRVQHATK